AGSQARDARVQLTIDGRGAGAATAALGPDDSSEVTFPVAARGSVAAVSVDDPDGVAADNTRFAALSGSSRPGVLLVTGNGSAEHDAFYVQHALAAGQPRSAYDVALVSGAQLSTGDPSIADRLAAQSAVVLLSTRGLERRGRELLAAYVTRGGGLM